jgi:predicted Zn-dependent peptidase
VRKIVLLLCAASVCYPATDLVRHPRELKYPPLKYQPPKASDYRQKLSSGSTAYMVEDHQLPLIQLSVLVRTGEYLEPTDKVALASLTGSQMRAGGSKTRPPAEFDEQAAFVAAQIGSGISDTEGSASVNCLSKDIDVCLDLFFDMLRNPGFAEDRLKLAKAQAIQGLERRNDSTTAIENREFARLLRGPDFFSARQATKATIESITRDDLVAFHSKYYFPANFTFAVSGDFSTPDMVAKLNKAMAGWQNRTDPIAAIPTPQFTPKPGLYVVDKKGVNQGRVALGHIGTTFTNPDHIAVNVMNGVLGGTGFTSRITTRVRSDEGLAYSAGSTFPAGAWYPSLFRTFFQSKSMSVPQAIAISLEEIDRIRKDKVTSQELEVVKDYMMNVLPQRFATASLKAGQFAQDDFEKRPEDYWQKYADRVKAVTDADVLRVAQKYLQPDKLVILVVGDAETILKGNPDKPQYQLSKFGAITRVPLPDPLTMVYPAQ